MTPEEQLDYEARMARVLEIRQPGRRGSSLQIWLNSTVLSALVGVAGTALLGAYVSGKIQERSKLNEMEVVERKETRAARAATVEKVLDILGQNISATDDLLVTANSIYDEARYEGDDRAKIREWKQTLRERRDKADSDWRNARRSLGYTLAYHFGGDRGVVTAWQEVVNGSDAFERCTNQWYTLNARAGSNLAVSDVCAAERAAYEHAVEALTTVVSRP